MKTMTKGDLKARLFEYFQEIEEHGGELIVTEGGKPVLKIVSCRERKSVDELFGEYRAMAHIPRHVALESTANLFEENG